MSKHFGFKVGIASLIMMGAIQASPIVLTAISDYQADMSWQDIKSTTYTWTDANANNRIDIGEKVSFTVDMEKAFWGVHDFDALKVWIDGTPINPPSTTLYSNSFIWNFDQANTNKTAKWWNPATNKWEDYSYKAWTGGDKFFSFDYTFTNAGIFDLTASVMCSADLSGLNTNDGSGFDSPTTADWNAWTEAMHGPGGSKVHQGETERYQLQVYAAVPEPSSIIMVVLGLAGVIAIGAGKRKKTA